MESRQENESTGISQTHQQQSQPQEHSHRHQDQEPEGSQRHLSKQQQQQCEGIKKKPKREQQPCSQPLTPKQQPKQLPEKSPTKQLTHVEREYWQQRLPHGFQFYLERLARGVIRNQPSNILEFSSVYLEELLVGRNELWKLPAKPYFTKLFHKKCNGTPWQPRRTDMSPEREELFPSCTDTLPDIVVTENLPESTLSAGEGTFRTTSSGDTGSVLCKCQDEIFESPEMLTASDCLCNQKESDVVDNHSSQDGTHHTTAPSVAFDASSRASTTSLDITEDAQASAALPIISSNDLPTWACPTMCTDPMTTNIAPLQDSANYQEQAADKEIKKEQMKETAIYRELTDNHENEQDELQPKEEIFEFNQESHPLKIDQDSKLYDYKNVAEVSEMEDEMLISLGVELLRSEFCAEDLDMKGKHAAFSCSSQSGVVMTTRETTSMLNGIKEIQNLIDLNSQQVPLSCDGCEMDALGSKNPQPTCQSVKTNIQQLNNDCKLLISDHQIYPKIDDNNCVHDMFIRVHDTDHQRMQYIDQANILDMSSTADNAQCDHLFEKQENDPRGALNAEDVTLSTTLPVMNTCSSSSLKEDGDAVEISQRVHTNVCSNKESGMSLYPLPLPAHFQDGQSSTIPSANEDIVFSDVPIATVGEHKQIEAEGSRMSLENLELAATQGNQCETVKMTFQEHGNTIITDTSLSSKFRVRDVVLSEAVLSEAILSYDSGMSDDEVDMISEEIECSLEQTRDYEKEDYVDQTIDRLNGHANVSDHCLEDNLTPDQIMSQEETDLVQVCLPVNSLQVNDVTGAGVRNERDNMGQSLVCHLAAVEDNDQEFVATVKHHVQQNRDVHGTEPTCNVYETQQSSVAGGQTCETQQSLVAGGQTYETQQSLVASGQTCETQQSLVAGGQTCETQQSSVAGGQTSVLGPGFDRTTSKFGCQNIAPCTFNIGLSPGMVTSDLVVSNDNHKRFPERSKLTNEDRVAELVLDKITNGSAEFLSFCPKILTTTNMRVTKNPVLTETSKEDDDSDTCGPISEIQNEERSLKVDRSWRKANHAESYTETIRAANGEILNKQDSQDMIDSLTKDDVRVRVDAVTIDANEIMVETADPELHPKQPTDVSRTTNISEARNVNDDESQKKQTENIGINLYPVKIEEHNGLPRMETDNNVASDRYAFDPSLHTLEVLTNQETTDGADVEIITKTTSDLVVYTEEMCENQLMEFEQLIAEETSFDSVDVNKDVRIVDDSICHGSVNVDEKRNKTCIHSVGASKAKMERALSLAKCYISELERVTLGIETIIGSRQTKTTKEEQIWKVVDNSANTFGRSAPDILNDVTADKEEPFLDRQNLGKTASLNAFIGLKVSSSFLELVSKKIVDICKGKSATVSGDGDSHKGNLEYRMGNVLFKIKHTDSTDSISPCVQTDDEDVVSLSDSSVLEGSVKMINNGRTYHISESKDNSYEFVHEDTQEVLTHNAEYTESTNNNNTTNNDNKINNCNTNENNNNQYYNINITDVVSNINCNNYYCDPSVVDNINIKLLNNQRVSQSAVTFSQTAVTTSKSEVNVVCSDARTTYFVNSAKSVSRYHPSSLLSSINNKSNDRNNNGNTVACVPRNVSLSVTSDNGAITKSTGCTASKKQSRITPTYGRSARSDMLVLDGNRVYSLIRDTPISRVGDGQAIFSETDMETPVTRLQTEQSQNLQPSSEPYENLQPNNEQFQNLQTESEQSKNGLQDVAISDKMESTPSSQAKDKNGLSDIINKEYQGNESQAFKESSTPAGHSDTKIKPSQGPCSVKPRRRVLPLVGKIKLTEGPVVGKIKPSEIPRVGNIKGNDGPRVRDIKGNDGPRVRDIKENEGPRVRDIKGNEGPLVVKMKPSVLPVAGKTKSSRVPLVGKIKPTEEPVVGQVMQSNGPCYVKRRSSKESLIGTINRSDKTLVEMIEPSVEQLAGKIHQNDVSCYMKRRASEKPLRSQRRASEEPLTGRIKSREGPCYVKRRASEDLLVGNINANDEPVVATINTSDGPHNNVAGHMDTENKINHVLQNYNISQDEKLDGEQQVNTNNDDSNNDSKVKRSPLCSLHIRKREQLEQQERHKKYLKSLNLNPTNKPTCPKNPDNIDNIQVLDPVTDEVAEAEMPILMGVRRFSQSMSQFLQLGASRFSNQMMPVFNLPANNKISLPDSEQTNKAANTSRTKYPKRIDFPMRVRAISKSHDKQYEYVPSITRRLTVESPAENVLVHTSFIRPNPKQPELAGNLEVTSQRRRLYLGEEEDVVNMDATRSLICETECFSTKDPTTKHLVVENGTSEIMHATVKVVTGNVKRRNVPGKVSQPVSNRDTTEALNNVTGKSSVAFSKNDLKKIGNYLIIGKPAATSTFQKLLETEDTNAATLHDIHNKSSNSSLLTQIDIGCLSTRYKPCIAGQVTGHELMENSSVNKTLKNINNNMKNGAMYSQTNLEIQHKQTNEIVRTVILNLNDIISAQASFVQNATPKSCPETNVTISRLTVAQQSQFFVMNLSSDICYESWCLNFTDSNNNLTDRVQMYMFFMPVDGLSSLVSRDTNNSSVYGSCPGLENKVIYFTSSLSFTSLHWYNYETVLKKVYLTLYTGMLLC